MGLSSAIQWWEVWQLRILVLASLFFQYLPYFSVWVRRAPILRSLRVLVWIAYIGGDAVAIYALATLFNRQKQTSNWESSALEVLWAPVLLIHLGGQPCITAYCLEDNELWKRHTITLVCQVTVALYVFCKWWSGEKTLLAAAVLLFLFGILKFAQKPWALWTASFNSIQGCSSVFIPEDLCSLEDYVQAAKKCVLDAKVFGQYDYKIFSNYMFVDRSAPYFVRIQELSSFLKLEHKHAYSKLQECLGDTFDSLYTRKESVHSLVGVGSMLLLPFLVLSSTVLFGASHKDGHNEKDIRVTYILFCCTTVLEFLFPCMLFCQHIPCFYSFIIKHIDGWHHLVSQYNIMSCCVRKKRPSFLMKLATFNFLSEFINHHWYIQQVPVAYQFTEMVRLHVEDGWRKYIRDATSYRIFNDLRGQWAVRIHHQLEWSLKRPFDESVLIWHIATDLCFYHPNTSSQCQQEEATQHTRELSNYMIYLLLIRPEMLMTGTRPDLFTLASDIIVENSKGDLEMTEKNLVKEILNMPMLTSSNDMIPNARKLAGALMEMGGEEERWTVIQGVWVEMLCYSASRFRGYLHAKSLGDGGECLSIISLLLSMMGMETFADRHQRSETPQQVEEPVTSPSQGTLNQYAENFRPV